MFEFLQGLNFLFRGLGQHPDRIIEELTKEKGKKLLSAAKTSLGSLQSSIETASFGSRSFSASAISETSSLSHMASSYIGPTPGAQNSILGMSANSAGSISSAVNRINMPTPTLKEKIINYLESRLNRILGTETSQKFMGMIPASVIESIQDPRIKLLLIAVPFLVLMIPKKEKFLRKVYLELHPDDNRRYFEIRIGNEHEVDSFSFEIQSGKPLKFSMNNKLNPTSFNLNNRESHSSYSVALVSGVFNVGTYYSAEFKAIYSLVIYDPQWTQAEEAFCFPISSESIVRIIHSAPPQKSHQAPVTPLEESVLGHSDVYNEVTNVHAEIETSIDYAQIDDDGQYFGKKIWLPPYKEGGKDSKDYIQAIQHFSE